MTMLRKAIERLDIMVRNFGDDGLEEVMVHIGRLGNVGIVFAGIVGIIKYRAQLFPAFPSFGIFVGIIGLLITLTLLASISLGVWKSVHAAMETPWIGHLFGIVASGFVILLGIGAIIIAANP